MTEVYPHRWRNGMADDKMELPPTLAQQIAVLKEP